MLPVFHINSPKWEYIFSLLPRNAFICSSFSNQVFRLLRPQHYERHACVAVAYLCSQMHLCTLNTWTAFHRCGTSRVLPNIPHISVSLGNTCTGTCLPRAFFGVSTEEAWSRIVCRSACISTYRRWNGPCCGVPFASSSCWTPKGTGDTCTCPDRNTPPGASYRWFISQI